MKILLLREKKGVRSTFVCFKNTHYTNLYDNYRTTFTCRDITMKTGVAQIAFTTPKSPFGRAGLQSLQICTRQTHGVRIALSRSSKGTELSHSSLSPLFPFCIPLRLYCCFNAPTVGPFASHSAAAVEPVVVTKPSAMCLSEKNICHSVGHTTSLLWKF
ncbi:hypothetical protein GOODEAATRI_016173 [Goodea atripinnis]|uniref:Uncharacterized protein n=1 Tax=Goodea atripinnis TaxID=208336 RepID=A0ABV0N1X3_9TELE